MAAIRWFILTLTGKMRYSRKLLMSRMPIYLFSVVQIRCSIIHNSTILMHADSIRTPIRATSIHSWSIPRPISVLTSTLRWARPQGLAPTSWVYWWRPTVCRMWIPMMLGGIFTRYLHWHFPLRLLVMYGAVARPMATSTFWPSRREPVSWRRISARFGLTWHLNRISMSLQRVWSSMLAHLMTTLPTPLRIAQKVTNMAGTTIPVV